MKKNELMNKATQLFGKATLELKKHSPEILVVSGIVGLVASAVVACKASTKVTDIVTEAKGQVEDIHANEEEYKKLSEISNDSYAKALVGVYFKTGCKLFKLYAPSIALGALSVTSILAGNNILRKRNVAITAAYAAVDKTFNEYRTRVKERFGEEVENELRYNIQTKEIKEKIIDENGNETEVTKTVKTLNAKHNMYAKCFDETNINWDKNPDFNLNFILQQQNLANDKLRAYGYLFLNDVYDMLGFDDSQ